MPSSLSIRPIAKPTSEPGFASLNGDSIRQQINGLVQGLYLIRAPHQCGWPNRSSFRPFMLPKLNGAPSQEKKKA
jgi:hypothetical protein